MPYSTPLAYRSGKRLIIEIDLSVPGEMSRSGRARNIVDPAIWHDYVDDHEFLGIKLTVCRPLSFRGR